MARKGCEEPEVASRRCGIPSKSALKIHLAKKIATAIEFRRISPVPRFPTGRANMQVSRDSDDRTCANAGNVGQRRDRRARRWPFAIPPATSATSTTAATATTTTTSTSTIHFSGLTTTTATATTATSTINSSDLTATTATTATPARTSTTIINPRGMKDSLDTSGPCETTALHSRFESFDDVLPHVGDFGKYQWLLLLSLLPFSIIYANLYFSQFFFTIVPMEHWCRVDELVEYGFTPPERILAAIPARKEYPYYDPCRRKDLNYSEILRQRDSKNFQSDLWKTNETVECEKWEYNFTEIPYASIAAELDWVCDREYLISTAQAIFFSGSIVGGFVIGYIADHNGRIPALVICNGIALIASIATASARDFRFFAVSRFFTGLAFDNCINIPLIVVLEYMAVKRRSLVVNVAFGIYFALGSTLLPWISYYIANWRSFAYVSAVPLLSVFVTPWILPESARWYVSKGKTVKVLEKLGKIARVNGKNPDPRILEAFARNLNTTAESELPSATILDLFKHRGLARNTILLIFVWSMTVIAFDGHVYALKLLRSSVFVSFSLASSTEVPAGLLLALVLDKWGRRFCTFITLAVTCGLTVADILLASNTAKLTMSVLSRFCLNMTANVVLQYAAELLPTPVRAQGISLIHIFGVIAHCLAPYIVDMEKLWVDLPLTIITAASFVGAALVTFLPETLGRDLPQTIREGEELDGDQPFWRLPCISGFKQKSRQDSTGSQGFRQNYSA